MLGFYRATHFALQIAGLRHALQRQRSDRGNEPRASAHARALTATRQSVASETRRGVSASGHGRSPVAWRGDRGCRRMGNFPPCKALKTHENAEGISILPEPRPG
jgi:hypothetical protein